MRPRAALLIAALALSGCAARDRANPFDPSNQGTQGRPVGFTALARDGHVVLRWNVVENSDLAGYRIRRRVPGDTVERTIATLLDPGVSSYTDFGTLNGLDHSYRLSWVFRSGGESPSADDTATPGPAVAWVADGTYRRLARLTADGRHVDEDRTGFLSPTAVAVDTVTRDVWMADGARLWLLHPVTGVLVSIPTGGTPGEIAVDPAEHGAWVCLETDGEARYHGADGALQHTIAGLGTPIGLALDPVDGTLWICERDSNRVSRHDPDTGRLGVTGVTKPSRVAVDAVTREAWVTSYADGKLHRLGRDGAITFTLAPLGGPVGVAVDAVRGRVWVADLDLDRVLVLERDGTPAFTVGGLAGPRAVAVDVETGEAWVACAASGEVVRIDAAGTVLRRLRAFGSATGIALDPLGSSPPLP